ncbi:MAG: TIGR01777 family protein [Vampirovibrio sp.]|nr:TIGR01777 family protein [Vampirovibrio sp.]
MMMLPAFSKILHEFCVESRLPVPPEVGFAWHERPQTFGRLNAPWESVRLLKLPNKLSDDETAIIQVALTGRFHPWLPLWKTWLARHHNYVAGAQFTDTQETGPFSTWSHTHSLLANETDASGQTSLLQDKMHFQLPLAPLSDWLGGLMVIRLKLMRMFRYRHEITKLDLERHSLAASNGFHHQRILISGASGMVGRALIAFLVSGGHTVVRLVRNQAELDCTTPAWVGTSALYWQPETGETPTLEALEGFDACIHLGGANIAEKRWNPQVKQTLWQSRVQSTQLLAEILAKLAHPPKVFVTASGVRALEAPSANPSFLKQLADAWEQATLPASDAGIRCVQLRLGVVLGLQGGLLAKLVFPFLLGGGVCLDNGKQSVDWVSLEDVLGAVYHCLYSSSLSGGVTVVAPESSTNEDFTKAMHEVLFRPYFGFSVPAWALRLLAGAEFTDAVLLNAERLETAPAQLMNSGFDFAFPALVPALRFHLGVASPLESLLAIV